MLDENDFILSGRNRKDKKDLFKAIATGSFEYEELFPMARESTTAY